MNLVDLLKAVGLPGLTKSQLEEYHLNLTSLYAQVCLEMSDLEKAEAIYFLENKNYIVGQEQKERSDVVIKRMWRGTPEGQRLITLKNYEKAANKMLASIKSRLYAIY